MKSFNLIYDAWIQGFNLETDECVEYSILDALLNAKEFEIVGESKIQDLAIQELLQAIVARAYDGYDDGSFDRWVDIYEQGKFNKDVIEQYLEKYKDFFWLINDHGNHKPFMQLLTTEEMAKIDKIKSIKYLVTTIDESENKERLYATNLKEISLAEGARWLVAYQACSTQSITQGGGGVAGVPNGLISGRLAGKLCLSLKGNNLFENILLNSPCVNDDVDEEDVYTYDRAYWEIIDTFDNKTSKVDVQRDLALFWTMPVKRCLLLFNDEFTKVVGLKVASKFFYHYDEKSRYLDQTSVWWVKSDGTRTPYSGAYKYMPLIGYLEATTTQDYFAPKETKKNKEFKYLLWVGRFWAKYLADTGIVTDWHLNYAQQSTDGKNVMFTALLDTDLVLSPTVFEETIRFNYIVGEMIKPVMLNCQYMLVDINMKTENPKEKPECDTLCVISNFYKNATIGLCDVLKTVDFKDDTANIVISNFLKKVLNKVCHYCELEMSKMSLEKQLFVLSEYSKHERMARQCLTNKKDLSI